MSKRTLTWLADVHPAVLRPPLVERRIADPVLAAQLTSRKSRMVFLQNPDNLFLAKSALPHRLSPFL